MKTALSILNDISTAIQSACLRDFPDFQPSGNDFRGKACKARRPDLHLIDGVEVFQQLWASTALGFGGVGGAAMTSANTVIVTGPMGEKAVYFGGGFAYLIERPNKTFLEDAAAHSMVERSRAKSRYEEKTEATK